MADSVNLDIGTGWGIRRVEGNVNGGEWEGFWYDEDDPLEDKEQAGVQIYFEKKAADDAAAQLGGDVVVVAARFHEVDLQKRRALRAEYRERRDASDPACTLCGGEGRVAWYPKDAEGGQWTVTGVCPKCFPPACCQADEKEE